MEARPRTEHLYGLDAIRFVAAVVVFLSHIGGPPLFANTGTVTGLSLILVQAERVVFAGPAAVVVFFVLSGLVIHHPNHSSGTSPRLPFFLRRYIRILGPIIAIRIAAMLVGHGALGSLRSVLWSLWAELIYYSVYPFLLPLGRRYGWPKVIAASFVASFLVTILEGDGNFTPGDTRTAWIVGLPCWLIGCWLAEHLSVRPIAHARLWAWRAAIYASTVVALILRFHTPIAYGYTLPAFAIVVAMWLDREIAYYRAAPDGSRAHVPWRWLERAGAWSYSLYLGHFVAMTWVEAHPAVHDLLGTQRFVAWTWEFGLSFALCWAFSRVVERPFQQVARWAATAASPRKDARAAA